MGVYEKMGVGGGPRHVSVGINPQGVEGSGGMLPQEIFVF